MANTFKFGNKNWAVKKDYVLAYNDENNNFKPLPFDFTRDSIATYVDSDGLIKTAQKGIARIDYLDNTDGHLLLEPSRTNYITYSEDFTQWQKLNSTVTDNSIVSPDGTQNADLVNYSITSANGYIRLAHTASQTVTFYIKYNDLQWIMVYGSGLAAGKFIDINNNIIGGNVGSGATAEIVDANNGWKRVTLSSTSANITQTSIYAASSDGSYATITITGGIYLWGAQAEVGSYATSYIPTEGETKTRVADACNQTPVSGIIGQTEGTLFLDFIRKPQVGSTEGLFGISSSNNADRVIIWNNYTSNSLALQIKANGSNVINNQSLGTFNNDENYKIAISYKSGEIKLYVNGNSVLNLSNSFTFASDLNTIILNAYQVGMTLTVSPFKEIKIYNTALTDSELETLTT